MGLSKSKTTTKSNETLAPSTYSQPYIDQSVQGVNRGAQQSQDLYQKYLPQAEKSLGYYGDVLGGKYLEGNPYIDGMIDQTNENVSNRVNSNFSSAGRYGSDYHTGELTRGLADSENNLRFSNYANERGMQNGAALGNMAGIEQLVGLPANIANAQANAINGLVGKYVTSNGTNVSKSSPSLLSLLANGAGAAAQFASDIRLKTNIERVGETPDGLGIYDYDYLPIEGQIAAFMPEGRQRGVIAQEVALLRPDALGPVIDGYATVNYAALGAM
ncbi:MAG: tail fiber domain-containing protein [Pseudomonadota bacterium]